MRINADVDARSKAAIGICFGRGDDWRRHEDKVNAYADADAALEAIGFDDIVASRERAINLAVALEEQLSDDGMTGLLLDNLP